MNLTQLLMNYFEKAIDKDNAKPQQVMPKPKAASIKEKLVKIQEHGSMTNAIPDPTAGLNDEKWSESDL